MIIFDSCPNYLEPRNPEKNLEILAFHFPSESSVTTQSANSDHRPFHLTRKSQKEVALATTTACALALTALASHAFLSLNAAHQQRLFSSFSTHPVFSFRLFEGSLVAGFTLSAIFYLALNQAENYGTQERFAILNKEYEEAAKFLQQKKGSASDQKTKAIASGLIKNVPGIKAFLIEHHSLTEIQANSLTQKLEQSARRILNPEQKTPL